MHSRENWKRNNTETVPNYRDNGNHTMLLNLYGHNVAELWPNGDVRLSHCGYRTATTKDRLNGFPNVYIVQKASEWYIVEPDGNRILWDSEHVYIDGDGYVIRFS